jgi:3-dehydroquinate synthase
MTFSTVEFSFPAPELTCRVLFGEAEGGLAEACSGRVLLVCDQKAAALHGHRLPARLPRVMLPGGERRKTLATVRRLYRVFLEHGVDRSSLIVGVGGGITCDVTGFAAATFMRGIPCGFVPTTLLAQADAALGGKNGVNLHGYKNMVGTFVQPRFIFCDPAFLETLPRREFACGLAELVKTAAVADEGFFCFLERHATGLLQRDRALLGEAIAAAVRIKMGIAGRDERDGGERTLLNFGHTLAHALEKSSAIRHGEAVSIGMAAAAAISVRCRLAREEEQLRLTALLQRFGLPVRADLSWEAVGDALGRDKKKRDDRIDLVLLRRLGRGVVRPMAREQMENHFHDLHMHR